MTIEELIIYGKKYIHSIDAKMLLANLLNYDTLELLTHLDEIVPEEKVKIYKDEIEAFKRNIPLQYIIGNTNFFGYEFIVNKNVLIPRFETEELVDNTIKWIENNHKDKQLKVVDLGCGSGIIGITLKKKLPYLDVTCLDISKEALEVTKENKEKLNADIKIIWGDMLENNNEYYDIIISNPPYISKDEKIEDIVRENEPHLALYAEEEGTYFYRKILESIAKREEKPYLVAFEIGYLQKEKVTMLAKEILKDVSVECKKDLAGKDRMIFIEIKR